MLKCITGINFSSISTPVDFNLISPRHRSRIGGKFVNSPHKKFQKSRVAYYSNCTASFNPVALSVVRSGDIHPHPGPHRQCNSTCKSANAMTVLVKNARSVIGRLLEITMQPYATAARCGLTLNAAV